MRNVIPEIEFQVRQINSLFHSFEEPLQRCRSNAPNFLETVALASLLHSFYNGLESIFILIAKNIDRGVPNGPQWHRDLLLGMAEETTERKTVISAVSKEKLVEYLAFRHFYRHSYSHILEWGELEKLVIPITDIWNQIERELLEFVKYLRNAHTE